MFQVTDRLKIISEEIIEIKALSEKDKHEKENIC